jgi:hypothetical protein
VNIHGNVEDLSERVDAMAADEEDLLIILGDCAFFYNCYFKNSDPRDYKRQKEAANLPCTILCIQGNHEQPFKEMDAERVKIFD